MSRRKNVLHKPRDLKLRPRLIRKHRRHTSGEISLRPRLIRKHGRHTSGEVSLRPRLIRKHGRHTSGEVSLRPRLIGKHRRHTAGEVSLRAGTYQIKTADYFPEMKFWGKTNQILIKLCTLSHLCIYLCYQAEERLRMT